MQICRVSVLASFLTYVAARSILESQMEYSGVCNLLRSHILNVLLLKDFNNSASSKQVGQDYANTIPMKANRSKYPATALSP